MTDKFNIVNNVLIKYEGDSSLVVIPEGVKEIASAAISANSFVTEIRLPNSLKKINTNAIALCFNLSTINIPTSIKDFGKPFISNCPNLENLQLNQVVQLPEYAFDEDTFIRLSPNFYPSQLSPRINKLAFNTVMENIFNETKFEKIESWKAYFEKNKKDLLHSISDSVPAFIALTKLNILSINDYEEIIDFAAQEDKTEFSDFFQHLKDTIYEDCDDFDDDDEYPFNHDNGFDEDLHFSNSCIETKFYFRENPNGTVKIMDIMNYPKKLTIPEKLDGKKVTSIDGDTFSTYSGYEHKNNACYLEEITIPETVSTLGEYTFYECNSLKSAKLPKSVRTLPDALFAKSKKLTDVTLGDNVSSIRNSAFAECSSLEKIVIPGKIKFIGYNAFYKCKKLKQVIFKVKPQNKTLIELDSYAFSYSGLESIEIPSGVSKLNTGLFRGCKKLKEVILPESVTTVGSYVFNDCPNLQSIKIKNKDFIANETTFDEKVYNKLAKYFCPHNLTSAAKKIVVGAAAKIINEKKEPDAEWKAEWVKYLKNRKKSRYDEILNNKDILIATINEDLFTLNEVKELSTLAAEQSNIEASAALLDYQNKKFSVEDLIKETEKTLLVDVTSLTYLKTLWNFKKLEDGTICLTSYKGTKTDIEVPSYLGKHKVTALGKSVFSPTDNRLNQKEKDFRKTITSIKIPDGITSIGPNAFIECESLTELKLPEGLKEITSSTKKEYSSFNRSFLYGTKVENIVIPSTVKHIRRCAFYICPNLKYVTLPEGLQSIEAVAFAACENLGELTIPKSVSILDGYSMQYCKGLKKIKFNDGSKLKTLDYATIIGCKNLEEVILPEGLQKFNDLAILECTNLKKITLPGTLKTVAIHFNENVTCQVKKGSVAEKYAKANSLKYKAY